MFHNEEERRSRERLYALERERWVLRLAMRVLLVLLAVSAVPNISSVFDATVVRIIYVPFVIVVLYHVPGTIRLIKRRPRREHYGLK